VPAYSSEREARVNKRLELAPLVDMNGNPLSYRVHLPKGSIEPRRYNSPMWPAAQHLETQTLLLAESSLYTDESGSERIVLTPESTGGSTQLPKLRWMQVTRCNYDGTMLIFTSHMREDYMRFESLEVRILLSSVGLLRNCKAGHSIPLADGHGK
jgi:hypothetical protein